MSLHIVDGLNFPDSFVTEVAAWIGRRGSGKTYGATKAAEEMYRIGAQFIALDSVGVWWGLRQSAAGDSRGLEIPIFGGLRGDIPIVPASGALVADVIIDQSLSAIVDTSQFESDTDKNRFVFDFISRLFFKKKSSPSAVHVFLEEAQEYGPQNIQKGEEKMLHAVQRMVRLGRNYGIGASIISQRPQDVNKKVLNQAECVFAFQLTGPQEIDAVKYWCQEKGYGEDLRGVLPKLETGYAHLWSPVFLNRNERVHISAKKTLAAGTTPVAGGHPKRARDLQPIEIETLKARMAATIEKIKADDPAELRRQIAELRAQISKASATPSVDINKAIANAVAITLADVEKKILRQRDDLSRLVATTVQSFIFDIPRPATNSIMPIQRPAVVAPPTVVARRKVDHPAKTIPSGVKLPKAERAILTALAQLGACSKERLAIVCGYAHNGGGFNNALSALRSSGFIENSGLIDITESGLSALGPFDPLPTGRDLLRYWIHREGKAERTILESLAQSGSMDKQWLASACGYAESGGGFNNALSRLRTLGLISGSKEITISRELL